MCNKTEELSYIVDEHGDVSHLCWTMVITGTLDSDYMHHENAKQPSHIVNLLVTIYYLLYRQALTY